MVVFLLCFLIASPQGWALFWCPSLEANSSLALAVR